MDRRAPMTFTALHNAWRVATIDDLSVVHFRLERGLEVWMCDYLREVLQEVQTFFLGPHVLEEVDGFPALQGCDHLMHRLAYLRLRCITPHETPLHVLEVKTCLYPGWRGIHHGRTQLYIPVRP